MATSLADPPAAQGARQPQGPVPGAAPPDAAAAAQPHACANCGAPLAAGQDWCLQCGTAAPGSLAAPAPGWRSGAAVLGAIAVLIAGAAGAAYAAFGKSGSRPRSATPALARVGPAVSPGTTTTSPPAVAGPTPTPKAVTPPTVKPTLPLSKLPKITVPPVAVKPTTSAIPVTPTGTISNPTKTSSPSSPEPAPEPQSSAILLDTNAATTYNPSNLPAGDFGDPNLAIDGESTTGWTALVDPASAPRMAAGLSIDLRTPQRLGALALVTSTPGMTVQVYGSSASTVPAAITDPGWTRVSRLLIEKKRRVRIALTQPKRALRFVALWISKAPASSPRRVSVNEVELFAPGK